MKLLIALVIAAIVILVLWLAPLLGIWAINTLFTLTIPYTFTSWLAMLVLVAIFGSGSVRSK